MANFNSTIADFTLTSTWTSYLMPDKVTVEHTSATPKYADKAYDISAIPAGAIIDSAILSATWESVYSGIDYCNIRYGGVDYDFRSKSLDITSWLQALGGSYSQIAFQYRFRANGNTGSASLSGTGHSGALGFKNNTLTVTYHMPVSGFSLSTSSLEAGQTITVNISRADVSYLHQVVFTFGGASQTFNSVATSQAFTIPLTGAGSWLYQIPNSTSGTASCIVHTYNSVGTYMGSAATQYFTVTAPASIKPTLTSLTATQVNGYWGLYVQGYSSVTLTANGATGTYGSTIVGYSVHTGTINPFTTGVLSTAGTNMFFATVTDSRGRVSDAVSTSISVTAYSAPVVTGLLVQRVTDYGGALNDEGTYCKVTPTYSWSAIGSNSRTTAVHFKETTSGTWVSGSTTLINSGGYIIMGPGFDIAKTYDVRFTVDDAISGAVYGYTTLQTAKYIMDFKAGGLGVCFGGVATKDNAMEVSPLWEMYYKNQTLDNRFLSKLGGVISATGANRASLSLLSPTDVPTDFVMGSNNTNAWSITSRSSTEGNYLGFYSYLGGKFAATLTKEGGLSISSLFSASNAGRTITIGPQNTGHCHYYTDADVSHWFNKTVSVAGEIYAGPSYNQKVYHRGNLTRGWGAPASAELDGHIYLQYV